MGKSRAKKPTLEQKRYIANAGLIVKNWLVLHDTEKELHLVSRGTGMNRRIKKRPSVNGLISLASEDAKTTTNSIHLRGREVKEKC